MITIINEKSSQAKEFATALGGMTGTIKDGPLAGEHYRIVYAAGHLYAFKPLDQMLKTTDPNEIKRFTTWDANELPFDRHEITWQKTLNPNTLGKGASSYMRDIKASLKDSTACVIATDNDPSGEGNLLGWEIVQGAHFTGDVYRCEHEDQSPVSVQKAFANLKRISTDPESRYRDGLYFKGQARSRFDFLTIQYTRVLTYAAAKKQVLPSGYLARPGRLKSAITQYVGNQQDLHENFKPHSSFAPVLYDEDGHKFIKKDSEFYETQGDAQQHLQEVPQDATSVELNVKKHPKKPPKMLDLATVAVRLKNKGYDTNTVQDLAEQMYQDNYLSYPRTEDEVITTEQFAKLKPHVTEIANLAGVDSSLISPDAFRKSCIGHGSHGANRPGSRVPENLDELRDSYGDTGVALYVELARSFLAEMAPDELLETHYYVDSSTKSYLAQATRVLDPGWTQVLKPEKDDEEDSSTLYTIPRKLTPGVYEKKATRPSYATMDSLMSFLKKNNIGTGATRLNTYNDLKNTKNKKRQLIQSKKHDTLTALGKIAFLGMHNTTLASPKMTANLETYLNGVRDNKVKESQVLNLFDEMFARDKKQILKNATFFESLPKHEPIKKAEGIFQPTGEKVSFKAGIKNYKFTDKQIQDLLAGKEIEFPWNTNSICYGKLGDRGEKFGFGFVPHFKFPERTKAKGTFKDGQEVEFTADFSGHKLTQDEINTVLAGDSISFKAKSKAGKTYTAHLHLEYSVPFKGKEKTWHLAFDERKSKSKYKKKK